MTVIFSRVFTGTLQRVSVMLGLIAGTLLAAALGRLDASGVMQGSLIAVPQFFPFGMPRFDIIASLPLIIFSIISMAEATGQTIATAEIVDRKGDAHAIVPRTIRGDAVALIVGGMFGTSLIITSGENVGIVRATGVRSRYVTAVAGVIFVIIALIAPVSRLASVLPGAVVGGTAVIVLSIIGVIGIHVLSRVDLRDHGAMFTLASGLAMGTITAALVNAMFQFKAPNHHEAVENVN